MKVWELMAKLSEAPAGLDVQVSMAATMNAEALEAYVNVNTFVIDGGDAEVIDENGDSIGTLSELAACENEDE